MSQRKKPNQKPPQKTKPQKPAGQPVDVSPTKNYVRPWTDEELRAAAAKLKSLTHRLGQQLQTRLQHIVDQYPAAVSRQFAHEGDSRMPRTVRQHPRTRERSTDDTFGDLICFHVGNAVLAYQDAVLGRPDNLRERLNFLEQIVTNGAGSYVPFGTNAHGFTLKHRHEAGRLLREEQEHERRKWEE